MLDPSSISRNRFLKLAAASAAAAALPVSKAGAAEAIARPIPKSAAGETLPVIGLGTSQVFESHGDAAAMDSKTQVLNAMYAAGGTVIDTAPSYGNAETVVGDLLEKMNARPKTFLATKVAEQGRAAGIASFENSFKVLKTDLIDLMQIHNLVDTATQLAVMREWKAAGKFRYIGITHWRPDDQEALADVMAKEELDFVQLNYSADVRQPENTLLPLAADRGIAVMVNRPFGRGGLLRRMQGKELPPWAGEIGCDSFAQLLLKFVVSHPAVTVAIPGTSNPRHMADNQGAGRGPVPDAKQREMIAALWS